MLGCPDARHEASASGNSRARHCLPVAVAPFPTTEGADLSLLPHREEVMQMVTYSDLIQIGILVVGIINLFLQNKKK